MKANPLISYSGIMDSKEITFKLEKYSVNDWFYLF